MHTRTPRRLALTVLAALLAVGLAACGDDTEATTARAAADTPADTDAGEDQPSADDAPTEVEVDHAQGTTTVPYQPETVVVFDLGTLVTLDSLGVEVAGVPDFQAYPESLGTHAEDTPKVGTLFEPDYEAVNAMDADLIIVAGRSSTAYGDLSELAPTIDLTVDESDFLGSLRTRTESLGEIFGLEDEVAQRLDAIEAAIDEVAAAAADAGTGLIVLTTAGEVSAYGPGSRFGLVHDAFGVAPAVEDVEAATHGDAISFEFILEADPDLLYVIDRDATIGEEGAAAEQVLDNELVAQTTAWQNGDVTYLDGFAWYIAPNGLTSVETMIDEIRSSVE